MKWHFYKITVIWKSFEVHKVQSLLIPQRKWEIGGKGGALSCQVLEQEIDGDTLLNLTENIIEFDCMNDWKYDRWIYTKCCKIFCTCIVCLFYF